MLLAVFPHLFKYGVLNMPNKITLVLDLTVEEGIELLQSLQKIQKIQVPKEITQWPYWCWNCKGKIEEKPETLVCPQCGVAIPEP